MTLEKAKKWLRIDEDYDDDIILDIIESIHQYFKNAITNYDKSNIEMEKTLNVAFVALLVDMYENRSLSINKASEKTRFLIQSSLTQAEYCFTGDDKDDKQTK